jgi:hypothetical protein
MKGTISFYALPSAIPRYLAESKGQNLLEPQIDAEVVRPYRFASK